MSIDARRDALDLSGPIPLGSAEPRSGTLIVLSGPSGVGKGSLLQALTTSLPGVVRSVSATTRSARTGEIDGFDYHFLSPERFSNDIAHDRFFEFAEYNGNYYGTPCGQVDEMRAGGLDVVLEIEVRGARIVRARAPEAVLIFVLPPSIAELEQRLRNRGTDSEARIAERLQIANDELSCLVLYDYAIVNDDFNRALDMLRAIVLAERCRVRHKPE